MSKKKTYEYPSNDFHINMPRIKWSMSLGDFTIQQTTNYSAWRAFWLRFMGWKVVKAPKQ